MSGTVRFSVIMGVYNPAGRRLFEAVESIVRQTAADWELLLLDDGLGGGLPASDPPGPPDGRADPPHTGRGKPGAGPRP